MCACMGAPRRVQQGKNCDVYTHVKERGLRQRGMRECWVGGVRRFSQAACCGALGSTVAKLNTQLRAGYVHIAPARVHK